MVLPNIDRGKMHRESRVYLCCYIIFMSLRENVCIEVI